MASSSASTCEAAAASCGAGASVHLVILEAGARRLQEDRREPLAKAEEAALKEAGALRLLEGGLEPTVGAASGTRWLEIGLAPTAVTTEAASVHTVHRLLPPSPLMGTMGGSVTTSLICWREGLAILGKQGVEVITGKEEHNQPLLLSWFYGKDLL